MRDFFKILEVVSENEETENVPIVTPEPPKKEDTSPTPIEKEETPSAKSVEDVIEEEE